MTTTAQRVDYLLDTLLAAWRDLPVVETGIGSWDLLDQIDYIEEWVPKEELLDELHRRAQQREISGPQRSRYTKLCDLIRRNRPVLARLRSS